ncbi:MAG: hypothetical protein ACOC9D_00975 [Thermodesulfobacteriota bacterium]
MIQVKRFFIFPFFDTFFKFCSFPRSAYTDPARPGTRSTCRENPVASGGNGQDRSIGQYLYTGKYRAAEEAGLFPEMATKKEKCVESWSANLRGGSGKPQSVSDKARPLAVYILFFDSDISLFGFPPREQGICRTACQAGTG